MTDTPRKTPCASCPYRRDVPSGIWHESEYDKLIEYDRDTPDQPMQMFSCHQGTDNLCSGWVAHADPYDLISLRIGVATGRVDPSVFDYQTSVPLFASGAEAAEHGKRDLNAPTTKAQRAIDKITKVRKIAGKPVIQ